MNLDEMKGYLYDDFDEISFPIKTLIEVDEKINDLKEDLDNLEQALIFTSFGYEYKLVDNITKTVSDIECLLSD